MPVDLAAAQAQSGSARDSLGPRPRAQASAVDYGRLAFALVVALLVGVQGALVYQGFTKAPVEVDEGLFIEVIRNAGEGHGYAARGLYVESGRQPFSSELSTGPTLLAPAAGLHALGLDPLVAGRVAALVYYGALLGALWAIGKRIGGKWAGLAATLGPVILDTFTNDHSPISAPQIVLGEYTAAAMAAWAIVVARRRAGLAGVLIGFAFLAKVVAIFLVPAVIVAIVLARRGDSARSLWRDLARFASAALTVVAAFEVVKLVTIGPKDYLKLVPTYWRQVQGSKLVDFMVTEKTDTLGRSWFLPTPVTLALVGMALVLLTAMVASRYSSWSAAGRSWGVLLKDDRAVLAIAGLVAGLVIVVGWFALKSTDPRWVRHPAPGLVIAAGTGAAVLIAAGSALRSWSARTRRMGTAVVLITSLVLALVSVRHVDASLRPGRFGYLDDQKRVAAMISATGATEVQGIWGPLVPLSVLADVTPHTILIESSPDDLLVLDMYYRGHLRETGRLLKDELCGEIIYEGEAVLCWPKPDIREILATDFGLTTIPDDQGVPQSQD